MQRPDVLRRARECFVLWRPRPEPPPRLVIGRLEPGSPVRLADERRVPLRHHPDLPDLWELPAAELDLAEGVHHYWFEVADARPGAGLRTVLVTDPFALTVDHRLLAPDEDAFPASVIAWHDGALVACDPDGTVVRPPGPASRALAPNHRSVIYDLPTAWLRTARDGSRARTVATFRDIAALIDPATPGANFRACPVTAPGRSYLHDELGVNVLQVLSPADSDTDREHGHAPSNLLAPDLDLGAPEDSSSPTPTRDLQHLVEVCHGRGMRFMADTMMAFAQAHPYQVIAPAEFFIADPAAHPGDPDAHAAGGGLRRAAAGTLWRYESFLRAYDPVTGAWLKSSPAGQLMQTALLRWMRDFAVDGVRVDSVENVFSWNFLSAYRGLARATWRAGYPGPEQEADERFLVVGEEIREPLDLVRHHRLDALWHEGFKHHLRAALIGEGLDGAGLEHTLRRALDCRTFGYTDLAQAVIYLTSHDVEGYRNERLVDFLCAAGVHGDEALARRVRLAFACLLTAVGIPQILAGDEFADRHDEFDAAGRVTQEGGRRTTPVDFNRAADPWRAELAAYVGRLVKLRTSSDALCVNEIDIFHVDLDDKAVFAWRRGGDDVDPVVVLANFSDFATPAGRGAHYEVPGWPLTPPGRRWRDVGQDRDVPQEWIGFEPIHPWEAKVYALM